MKLRYAPARPEDYDALERLMRREADYLGATLRRINLTWEALARLLRTVGTVHTIFADGARAGFYWVEQRGRVLHLHALVLEDAFRGRGIGRRVLARLVRLHRDDVDVIELGVHLANHRARKLYDAAGFDLAEIREDVGFAILRKRVGPRRPTPSP